MSGQSKTSFSPYTIRASPVGPGPLRRSPGSNERAGLRQEGYRADVEVRGTVRRGETTSRLVARQVSGTVQSANPGLPVRDRAEPQAPALPTLLLAVSATPVLFD